MMTREEILIKMDIAIRQDRERFFKVADTIHLQPKYSDKLEELEVIKQQWRDITLLEIYPEIQFPLVLPEWFPKVKFMSSWGENYVDETLQKQNELKMRWERE